MYKRLFYLIPLFAFGQLVVHICLISEEFVVLEIFPCSEIAKKRGRKKVVNAGIGYK